jgi:hypothetical protein
VHDNVAKTQFQWHFIPPSSCHCGGLWKAGVEPLRYLWKRTVGEAGDCGSTVVKVLRYKSESRWFDPRWCHEFFIDINSSDCIMALGSTASNGNEYREYFLGVNVAGA